MKIDNAEGNCLQTKNSSISKTSSCSSSFTFVEPTSERCCPSLAHLPTQVRSAITAHLDVVSKICLQGVSHHFRNVIQVDRARLNACARYVLACHFHDGTSNSGLLTICGLCKTSQGNKRYSGNRIRSIKDPRREATSWTGHALARISWLQQYSLLDWNETCLYRLDPGGMPICFAHFMGMFSWDPYVESLMNSIDVPQTQAAWLAFSGLHCTHCGKSISETETRLVGCADCKCDFCLPTPSYHFRRCGPSQSDRIPIRQVFRDPVTKWIYAMEGYGKNMIVMPVLFPTHRTDKTNLRSPHLRYIHDPRVVAAAKPMLIIQVTRQQDPQARVEAEKLGSLENKISTQSTPETAGQPRHSTFWDKIRRLRPTS